MLVAAPMEDLRASQLGELPQPSTPARLPATPATASSALEPMDTKSRHLAQRQLISMLQAHKRWGEATSRGKQTMSSTINQLLLLREVKNGGDWGALTAFDRLPERVAVQLQRRAARHLAKLTATHEELCAQFEQMRFAAQQLRQLQDDLANSAPAGALQPPALLVDHVLSISCAVKYAREFVAMYSKELVAKSLLLNALTLELGRHTESDHIGQDDEDDEDEDEGDQRISRDLGEVYVSSWMLQPMLCTARVALIMAAFKSEVRFRVKAQQSFTLLRRRSCALDALGGTPG